MADLQELIATVDQLSAEDLRKLSMHIKERADLQRISGGSRYNEENDNV